MTQPPTRPKLTSWLKDREAARHRCAVCEHPDAVKIVREFLRGRASGEITAGWRALSDYLAEVSGSKLSRFQLQRHSKQCEAKLHAAAKSIR